MTTQAGSSGSKARQTESPWSAVLAVGVIALSALAAYHNTFSVPLLLDDPVTIANNLSIRHLGSLGSVLSPPSDSFSAGRPFLNLTFAVNYAAGGLSVSGYHILNLLIHILAGVALLGIVRATLSMPRFKERYGNVALLLALAVATTWTLHPVQTESVTYISQRAESLMGLFYLLTLYFFIRAALSPSPIFWATLSIAACALGMMTKEVMVSAPLLVLLYDRAFIAGTFREAWRQRWRTYLGLAGTWLVLACLMIRSDLQNRGVGYQAQFTGWTYALTESKVVVDYLKLSIWPHPLVFDYGFNLRVNRFAEAAPFVFIVVALLASTLLALRRWPSLGFLGAWFFLILAPTSSIVPVAGQPMAENRLYLPLAAIVALELIGIYAVAGRKGILVAFPALAIILGTLTIWRNSDYRDEVTVWTDTVLKEPHNLRAHSNLGNILSVIPGRLPEAIVHYEAAVKINPQDAKAHYNLGNALAKIPGRLPDAVAQYEIALTIDPNDAQVHDNLGNALADIPDHLSEAIAHFEAALRINSDDPVAHNNFGNALVKIPGRLPEAIAQFEAALRINPDDPEAQNNLGIAFARTPGRLADAIAHLETALRLKPDYPEAHFNLGSVLLGVGGRGQEAWSQLEAAVQLRPDLEPLVARLRSTQP